MRSKTITKAKTHFLENDDLQTILEPADPREAAFTATKVVITVGPSCQEVDQLVELLKSGASCCRVDLTWGTLEYHRRSLQNLQEAMKQTRKLCAVMIDTVGRELTISREVQVDDKGWPYHEGQPMKVNKGDKITLTSKPGTQVDEAAGILPVSYERFPSMVQKGDTIFLGRYLVTGSEESSTYLTVDQVTEQDVVCTARTGALLDGLLTVFHTERSSEGVTNVQNELEVLCDTDKQMLAALAKEFEIDYVSLSFTRAAEDVESCREYLGTVGLEATKVIAKCETRQALYNFRAIAQASDGIVLSRGNLGLDLLPEKMAAVQKAVCAACNALGKPVLLTRVVDSMQSAPRPTRAEATDVANAVLDGVDGILLGAETLRGLHPRATVETILHICKQAEKVFDHREHFERMMQDLQDAGAEVSGMDDEPSSARESLRTGSFSAGASDSNLAGMASALPSVSKLSDTGARASYLTKLESVASSAVRAADKVAASLIIVFTQSGTTASLLSKFRPPMPIMTLVVPQLKTDGMKWRLEGRHTARQCLIERGLLPVLAAPSPSGETLLGEAVSLAAGAGIVRAHDHIVVVQMHHQDFLVKIVSVDQDGEGIANIRPKSLLNIVRAVAGEEGNSMSDEKALAASTGAPRSTLLAQNLAQNNTEMPEPQLGAATEQIKSSKADSNGK